MENPTDWAKFVHVGRFQSDIKEYSGILKFFRYFYGALSKSKFLCFYVILGKISNFRQLENGEKENFKDFCISFLYHLEINQYKQIWPFF